MLLIYSSHFLKFLTDTFLKSAQTYISQWTITSLWTYSLKTTSQTDLAASSTQYIFKKTPVLLDGYTAWFNKNHHRVHNGHPSQIDLTVTGWCFMTIDAPDSWLHTYSTRLCVSQAYGWWPLHIWCPVSLLFWLYTLSCTSQEYSLKLCLSILDCAYVKCQIWKLFLAIHWHYNIG